MRTGLLKRQREGGRERKKEREDGQEEVRKRRWEERKNGRTDKR